MTTQMPVATGRGDQRDGGSNEVEPPRARKSRKKLVLLVVLLAIVAGAGAFVMHGRGQASATPVPGEVVKLEPIYVNLADGHYLKLGVAMQASASAPKDLDGSMALDAAITVFSNEPMDDLSSPASRAKLKADLVKRITHAYDGHVYDVYFTEFVMQ